MEGTLQMYTLATLIDRHGVDVHDHLDRDELVPVSAGLQFQGDVAVIPVGRGVPASGSGYPQAVPADGVAVVRGENGGNTHLLLAGGDVSWDPSTGGPSGLDMGVLTVGEGATAWLAHPEHGYLGVGAGRFVVRRQREQADEVRMVAD
jgi:hypothetical protein